MTAQRPTPYACVDPDVGDDLWRLDDPDLTADLRRILEAHASVCHACRLDRDLDARARHLVRSGDLDVERSPVSAPLRLLPARAAGIAAALAIAASLAGALLLPPRPVGADLAVRGDDETRFVRPVEGEVVPADGVRLSWTPVEGAARYEVHVTGRDDAVDWRGTTESPEVRLPADLALADGGAYRAVLAVEPSDLLPPGRTSVEFRAGSLVDALAHRLRRAQVWTRGAGLAGLALLGLALVRRRG